jgi:hypothetical protein
MDLIYTNAAREDVGVLLDFSFDLAFGEDENDFELTVDIGNNCCEPKAYVYIEGTEYGGVIDGLNVDTEKGEITYTGRTWHGMIGSKVIEPDAGEAYLTVSGEANALLTMLFERLGLSDLFEGSAAPSGFEVKNFQFNRYVDAYSGIIDMLESVSAKLRLVLKNGKVTASALPVIDYSKDEQFDSDQIDFKIEKTFTPINHLICLGQGELTERLVLHLYADESGNISENQTFFGLDEVEKTYEDSSADTLETLKKNGVKKLKEYFSAGKTNIDFEAELTVYDVGDFVGTKEIITGVFVREKITKKIVTIKKNTTNIKYNVG